MKKQWKWMLYALALVALLVIAAAVYRSLSDRYAPETPPSSSVTAEGSSAKADAAEAPTESVGERAADFSALDQNGDETRLSDHFGKPLAVNFWASWCGPCCMELPAFDAAAKQYGGQIEFMMVNLTDGYSETVESVQGFLEENGYTFPVYFDVNEDAASAYGVYSIPLTVFIRADGTILTSHVGAMDDATLQGYLAQLLA